MPFLKRSSSLNRQSTYQVSRSRAEPDNAERPKGMIRCHVKLLDNTEFTCDVDKHSHGDVLLDEVFKHLDLLERDYFGVSFKDSDVTKWVDPTKLLKKQFKGTHTMNVEFRVKFYVPDPVNLHEELTRYQFYLQVKRDLYSTRLGSPGVPISDDMTGQFSLVPDHQEEPRISPNYTSNYRRISNTEGGPTEYYDEQVAAEEQAGQVCMDDLMSEGLLLIRMEADSVGRYGFIFRGGVDENGPVMVTKVTEGSAASLCNPPLEEGDQILYINGRSVSEQTHDRLIAMISASREHRSRELVLIVKPRNLNRINPTPSNPSISKLSDPGHMLRESLTLLKESLVNARALLHFDRLYRRKPGMAAIASKLPHNLNRNRYRDISAYDLTRVQLNEGPDYINANRVDLEIYTTGQINHYIAAQGPMQHTCKDFWQMVWEQNSSLVVMLTNVVEDGKVRCCKYWPDPHSKLEYGKYGVTNLSEQGDRVYVTRQLRLSNRMSGEERTVVHMQYIDWPDHGIPGSKVDFQRFVQSMRSFKGELKGPVVVHCSAGIGRTGVFILMETALCKMEVLEPIYPLDIVRIMRDQRGMLVQTPIQYQFACESIVKAYEDDYVEIEIPSKRHSRQRSPISYV